MKYLSASVIALCLAASVFLAAQPFVSRTNAAASDSAQQPDQAGSALQKGRTLLKRGQTAEALGYLQTALNLYTTSKNARGIGAAHNELGDLYLRQGQHKVALEHFQKAYQALSGAAVQEQQAGAAAGGAASRVAGSDASAATEAAASASNTGFNANLVLAKIGDTNFRLGRLSEASAAYSQMRVSKPEGAASRSTRRFGGLGGVLGSISTGRVDVAAPTSAVISLLEVTKELELYRTAIVYSTYELGMGRISYFNNDLEGAKKHFQNAFDASGASLASVAKLGQTRRFRAAARISLGDVALRQGKLKDASKYYSEAAKGAQEDKRLDLTWPAQRGLGRSLWLQAAQEKDPKKATAARESAISNYRDALKTIETLRQGSLRADEARTTFLSTTKSVFDEAASSLAEMALLAATPDAPLSGKALEYAAEAFRITEQSRARSLLDLLSETDAKLITGIPIDLVRRKQENLERQQDIAETLTGIVVAPGEPKKKAGDLEAELDKLQTDYDEIENQIRVASPRYAALTGSQPLSLAEVQQQVLDDKTVLLEYSLGTEASYLWTADSQSLRLYKLPPRLTLDNLAADLRAQLIPSRLQRRIVGIDVADPSRGLGVVSASEDSAGFVAAANAVYKAAVEPASTMIGEKRLLIVADGGLNYIPFEALVKSPASADYSSLPYLIKSNEIVYAPSASVIGAIRVQGAKPSGRAMLIVADPVFNSNDARARTAGTSTTAAETRGLGIESALTDVAGQGAVASAETAKMQGLPLARLTGTRTEAEQIVKFARTAGGQPDLWLDLEASEDNLQTRDVTKYRVVHIATHGLLNAERPQFTGLVLSLVGNRSGDGFLRTDEVFNMRLGSPLVMLSACETGLGKEKRGEGVIGLTRAFMYAGAPTVGVSLWSVADKSTADLMTDFYKRLLATGGESTSPTAAMRGAQLSLIAGKKYSAPFYWAPFVLVGEWR
ncbi:MAG: CHAT domain-containing tetratricopeptide repeat protein [Pyrinomonadaceae bacterium]